MPRGRVVEPLDVKDFADVAQLVLGPVGEILVQRVPADEPVVETTVGKHHVTVGYVVWLGPLPPPQMATGLRPIRLHAQEERRDATTGAGEDGGSFSIGIKA